MTRLALLGVGSSPVRHSYDAGHGTGGHLQPRLLRTILPERQLPEQGSEQSLYRRLPAAKPNAWGTGPCATGAEYYVGRRYACY